MMTGEIGQKSSFWGLDILPQNKTVVRAFFLLLGTKTSDLSHKRFCLNSIDFEETPFKQSLAFHDCRNTQTLHAFSFSF